MIRIALPLALMAAPAAAAAQIESSPDLGKAEAHCGPNDAGPAVLITVTGLKDRKGLLRAELYPDNDRDFLGDDNILVNAGKVFRRVEIAVPAAGAVQLCLRTPGAGSYTVSLLHDRDANRKFGLSSDGVGFPHNPRLGLSKPKAADARLVAGTGITYTSIRLNYRKGLLSFGPLRDRS